MANIAKIKDMCKKQGIKQGYLCNQLGVGYTFLNDVSAGKNRMTDERLYKIADILGTTYEYLTDQTDDPLPPMNNIISAATSVDEGVILKLIGKLATLSGDELHVLDQMLDLPPREFSHVLAVVAAMLKE